jgi:hypothetical protein
VRFWKRFVLVGLAGAAATLPGCGWSARDEFLASRQVTVRARPGDGSEIATNFRASPRARAAGTEVASRFDAPERR